MKYWILAPLALATVLWGQSYLIENDGRAPAAPSDERAPVLVELFTSEGCSSCPPADEVLIRLVQTQPVPGAEIIALGEHVDYWNRLGWVDRYSSPEFSTRQEKYAEAFGTQRIYTPQMIVDGQIEFVGSRMEKARDAIMRAARAPKAKIHITPAASAVGTVQLEIRVEGLPAINFGDTAEVLLAITESNLRSNVSRGENSGQSLSHAAVVRKLSAIGRVDSQAASVFATGVNIAHDWKRANLRAVVFVQERASRRVLGAGAAAL